jgi:enoyl-[acyl-carrier protein] reductase I
MGLFEGKQGIIMGVANDRSIAASIAKKLHSEGARLGFSHLPDKDERGKMEQRVRSVVNGLDPMLVAPCDVEHDEQIEAFFKTVEAKMGKIDFLVHSIAYAPTEDLRLPTLQVSRQGFKMSMDISVYSLIAAARAAVPLFNPGASVLALTYYGGEKVMPGYNLMGVCKAALDASVRYLAWDLGEYGCRVNAISAGPLRTLASSAVGDFKAMLESNAKTAPLRRNITHDEVGASAAFLLSGMASGITGEIMHVDAGYNVMGATGGVKE